MDPSDCSLAEELRPRSASGDVPPVAGPHSTHGKFVGPVKRIAESFDNDEDPADSSGAVVAPGEPGEVVPVGGG